MSAAPAPGFRRARSPSLFYGGGMLLIFVGQRILEVGLLAHLASIVGALAVTGGLAWRLRRARTRPPAERPAERSLATLYALGTAALILYFLNSDLLALVGGKTLEQRLPRVAGIITALWPALWLAATLPVVLVELALGSMGRAPLLDQGRTRAAMLSGLGVAFALTFCFATNYVASERDVKIDLSYFRSAKAGDSTKKIVRALDKPVQIYLFFPPANEVREEVDSYFSDLTRESKLLVIEHLDHALAPAKAKTLNVSGNGIIVVARDNLKEQIPMPLALESARSALKTLDQEVNKRLLGVTRKAKVAYLTTGHGERSASTVGETDRRSTIGNLRRLLVDQGFEVKDLGLAQGLGTDVPEGATAVLIVGPAKPFLPEEETALSRYLERKGRVLIAIDPDNGALLTSVLAGVGLKFQPITLAHDRAYWPRANLKADRINIATAAFSSHASISTLQQLGARAPIVMLGAGYLEKNDKPTVGLVSSYFTVHADPGTWNDINGNLDHDAKDETRHPYELAAAATWRNASAIGVEEEGRLVAFADSDFLSDVLLDNYAGPSYLALDAVRWLAGEEQIAGTISNEEDIPIAHTRKQELVWFYLSIVVGPGMVIAIGFAMTRRRRAARPRPKSRSVAPPAPELPPGSLPEVDSAPPGGTP